MTECAAPAIAYRRGFSPLRQAIRAHVSAPKGAQTTDAATANQENSITVTDVKNTHMASSYGRLSKTMIKCLIR